LDQAGEQLHGLVRERRKPLGEDDPAADVGGRLGELDESIELLE